MTPLNTYIFQVTLTADVSRTKRNACLRLVPTCTLQALYVYSQEMISKDQVRSTIFLVDYFFINACRLEDRQDVLAENRTRFELAERSTVDVSFS